MQSQFLCLSLSMNAATVGISFMKGATVNPYHWCGCSVFGVRVSAAKADHSWATCSWQLLCYVPTVRVKHCCWLAATGEPLLGPLLQTKDWQQNTTQSKQRAITKIERTPPQEGRGREKFAPVAFPFLSADPHSQAQ